MSTVFEATAEPTATRLDYWRHVLGGLLGPLDLRAPEDPDFRDRLAVGRLGPAGVADLTVSRPGQGDRRVRHVRAAERDLFQIGLQVHGRTVVEQGDRQAALEPGDLTLVDLSRPCRWVTGPSRVTVVVFPRELLPGGLTGLTAMRIPGRHGLGALASSLLRELPRHLDEPGGPRVGGAVVDVLTATLATCLGSPPRLAADTRRRTLLMQVQAFIDQHLGVPGLSPAGVAAANHISVRYLHKLFESEQDSVAEWIRRRRLERCRRDLLDVTRPAEAVSVIAARWGFRDPAHFSRIFRATYGMPPARYRTANATDVAFGREPG